MDESSTGGAASIGNYNLYSVYKFLKDYTEIHAGKRNLLIECDSVYIAEVRSFMLDLIILILYRTG